MPNKNVKLNLNKENIKSAVSMVDMMVASGSLYEEHPLFILIDEIVKECMRVKKEKK